MALNEVAGRRELLRAGPGSALACAVLLAVLLLASFARAQPGGTADDNVGWGTAADAPAEPTPPADASEPHDANDDVGWGTAEAHAGADDAASRPESAGPPADVPRAEQPSGDCGCEGTAPHLSVRALARTRVAAWTERVRDTPLAQARQSLDLTLRDWRDYPLGRGSVSLHLVASGHIEYDATYAARSTPYSAPEVEEYRSQIFLQETSANLRLGSVELTFGKQIVVWGQSEILGLLDMINPRDLREPVLTEPEDQRIAVLASRLQWTAGAQRFEFLVAHETFFGLRAPPTGFFSPMKKLLLSDDPALAAALANKELRYAHVPEHRYFNTGEYFGRYSYAGTGIDVSLQVGSLLDRLGVASQPELDGLGKPELDFRLYHPRYLSLGHAGAVPIGSWLLRWETSFDVRQPLTLVRVDAPVLDFVAGRQTRSSGLLGLTYFGLPQGTVGIEVAKSVLWDDRRYPGAGATRSLLPLEEPQAALRWSQTFLRERLRTRLVGVLIGFRQLDWVARAEVGYALHDGLELSIGYVTYHPSNRFGPFYGFTSHDRVFAGLRWDLLWK